MRVSSVVRDCHVNLSQINASYLPANRVSFRLNLIGGNGFILCASPVDDNCFRPFPWPIEYKWLVASSVGQSERACFQLDGTTFVLDAKVPAASAWWMSIGIALAPFSPRFESRKESLYASIRSVSVQLGMSEQTHKMLGLEPNTLMPNCPPKEDECLGVEFATGMGKLIKLSCFADVDSSHLIHLASSLSLHLYTSEWSLG